MFSEWVGEVPSALQPAAGDSSSVWEGLLTHVLVTLLPAACTWSCALPSPAVPRGPEGARLGREEAHVSLSPPSLARVLCSAAGCRDRCVQL